MAAGAAETGLQPYQGDFCYGGTCFVRNQKARQACIGELLSVTIIIAKDSLYRVGGSKALGTRSSPKLTPCRAPSSASFNQSVGSGAL